MKLPVQDELDLGFKLDGQTVQLNLAGKTATKMLGLGTFYRSGMSGLRNRRNWRWDASGMPSSGVAAWLLNENS